MRPAGDHLGNVFLVDLFLQHPAARSAGRRRRLFVLADLAFELRNAAVLQLGCFRIVAGALRTLDVLPQALELFLLLAHALDGLLLLLPLRRQAGCAAP